MTRSNLDKSFFAKSMSRHNNQRRRDELGPETSAGRILRVHQGGERHVSSAKHWYPSSVDQLKIRCVLCRIGRTGVGGGISADEGREIDVGRSSSIVRFPS